jgi:hypothetical protein
VETFGFFEKYVRSGNGAAGLHHYDMLKLCIMPSLTRKKNGLPDLLILVRKFNSFYPIEQNLHLRQKRDEKNLALHSLWRNK